jgi:hypothetical protein
VAAAVPGRFVVRLTRSARRLAILHPASFGRNVAAKNAEGESQQAIERKDREWSATPSLQRARKDAAVPSR